VLTNVYVDGYNLYYGCLKGTPYKWLDLAALCRHLLPRHSIQRIRYFTARVSALRDAQQPVRQEAYLRALQTIPGLTVHLGHFLTTTTRMPLAHPAPGGPRTVEVVKTEEKGSDVNLATYLLADAFRTDAEAFVVISNDSDLAEPIRLVGQELNMVVGILNPHRIASRALLRTKPTFTKTIRQGVLKASQFPAQIVDRDGTVTRPPEW